MYVINEHPIYTHASPRYHTIVPYVTIYEEYNYAQYDAYNGTYDKFWPCFQLTNTPQPKSFFVDIEGNEYELKGDLSCKPLREDYATITVGGWGYIHPYVNSNLESLTINYTEFIQPVLNTAWTHIQSFDNVHFIIRILGDLDTTKLFQSYDLKDDTHLDIAKGTIVTFNDNLYRCIEPTTTNPPSSAWEQLDDNNSVFNADVYVLANNGESAYFRTINDYSRNFVPMQLGIDDTLITWNLSACLP